MEMPAREPEEMPAAQPEIGQVSNDEILLKRAESLALEQDETVDETRTGILLFSLADEWYGVHISSVREICNEYVITPVPCVPDYVLGVINIRGEILSVTDLRVMMGLPETERPVTEELPPVIIVQDDTVGTALIVDAIGDIADIGMDSIEPPLAITDKAQSDYIAGTFYIAGRLAALVNLPRVLSPIVSG